MPSHDFAEYQQASYAIVEPQSVQVMVSYSGSRDD